MLKPTTQKPHAVKVEIINTTDEKYLAKFIDMHLCKGASISDALTEEIPFWEPRNPVFIDAPTGFGKTTFVIKQLIPAAMASGKNVLLLSNRVALNVQVKRTFMKEFNSHYLKTLSEDGVREQEDFGCVKIISYQSLGERLKNCSKDIAFKEWVSKVGFVVADEAHYFAADALFNAWTGFPLHKIVEVFRHAVRIYMTATANEVRNHIAQIEESLGQTRYERYQFCLSVNPNAALFYNGPRKMVYYKFEADFTYIDLHFVSKLDCLSDTICKSNDKTLVFVDNIKKGKEFADKLEEALSPNNALSDSNQEDWRNKVIYLDASSKQTPAWQELIEAEKFEARCLVTTKALDNGININDAALTSVVISTDDQVDFIQMLGRKRRADGEKIQLYVVVPSKSGLQFRKKKIDEHLDMASEYLRTKNKGAILQKIYMQGKSEEYNTLFPMNNDGAIYLNDVAYIKLQRKLNLYEAILSDATTFEESVAGWLGKTYTSPETMRAELVAFLESNIGSPLDETKQGILRSMVYQAMMEAGIQEPHPNRVNTLGISALLNRLDQLVLPYMIGGDWTITRHTGSVNDSASE